MATIKSFTSLEQSRVLAKILPLESADMYYFDDNGEEPKFKVRNDITYYYDSEDCLCCWSLAALLDVLPNNKHISTTLSRGGWKIEPTEYVDNWWCEYEDEIHTKNFSISADNPVDACVEMIIHLNELKML